MKTKNVAPVRVVWLTVLAMTAFAANSIFCRLALAHDSIDPATFTIVRLASGAAVLWVLTRRPSAAQVGGSWSAALALLAYAICFSFAYSNLAAGTGALLLFGAVQVTMVLNGVLKGERVGLIEGGGLALAFCGLIVLVAPGVAAPHPLGALLMILAGIAWGAYSLLGRGFADPLAASAGNFLRAIAMVVPLLLIPGGHWSLQGIMWAVLSGALASGLGYLIWYAALAELSATRAASVQLSVPVIAAIGGVMFLAEPFTIRLAISSVAVLGGIALVVRYRSSQKA